MAPFRRVERASAGLAARRRALAHCAAVILALAACGGSKSQPPTPPKAQPDPWQSDGPPGPPPPSSQELLATLATFNNDVCTCADNDCIERVTDARNKYTHDLALRFGDKRYSADVQEKGLELQKLYLECVKRIVKPEPGRVSLFEKKMQRYVELRDDMCACVDAQCVARVRQATLEHIDKMGHVPAPDDEAELRPVAMIKEIWVCASKVKTKP